MRLLPVRSDLSIEEYNVADAETSTRRYAHASLSDMSTHPNNLSRWMERADGAVDDRQVVIPPQNVRWNLGKSKAIGPCSIVYTHPVRRHLLGGNTGPGISAHIERPGMRAAARKPKSGMTYASENTEPIYASSYAGINRFYRRHTYTRTTKRRRQTFCKKDNNNNKQPLFPPPRLLSCCESKSMCLHTNVCVCVCVTHGRQTADEYNIGEHVTVEPPWHLIVVGY